MIGIVGGGIAGLFCARALARAGFDSTIFETDEPYAKGDVDAAFLDWRRRGVAQLRQPHSARSLITKLLGQRDPELLAALIAAGMVEWRFHLLDIDDPDVPHDPELISLLGRRTALEIPLRRLVQNTPGITILQKSVRGLMIESCGQRHRVAGVITDDGPLQFDQIIAVPGRRSKLADWLSAAGVPLPAEQTFECGVNYYSRYFRLLPGVDIPRGSYPSGPSASLPSVHFTMNRTDHDTFSFMLGVAPWRKEFRELRHDSVFMNFVATLPNVATWLHPEKCVPLRSVEPFAGLVNRYRGFSNAAGPLVENLYIAGDARFHTNPINGWGMALALRQSYMLCDVFTQEADPLRRLARFEREVDAYARSHYDSAAQEDAARMELWKGERPASDRGEPGSYRYLLTTVLPAIFKDQWIFRKVTRRLHLLDHPEEILHDREVHKRAERINASLDRSITEAQLLERVRILAHERTAGSLSK